MKQLILSLSFFLFLATFIQAQDIEVPQTNQPLITKRTASWCTNCGSWGWALFEDLLSDNRSNALVMAAHHSGNYLNDASNMITDNLGGFGQPTFFVNNANQNATNSGSAAARESIRNQVIATNAEVPVVQAGIRAEVDDVFTTYIEVKTNFFQEGEGKYKLGVYLIDRSFIGTQTPIGNNAEHKQVIRLALTDDIFGEEIANGAIAIGSTFEGSYSLPVQRLIQEEIIENSDFELQRFEIATIIWKENTTTGKYDVVNTNKTGLSVLSNVEEVAGLSTFTMQPTVANSQSIAQISTEETLEEVQLGLLNNQGQLIRNIFQGTLNEGQHQFEINRNELSAGLYYLQLLNQDGTTSTKRLIFR